MRSRNANRGLRWVLTLRPVDALLRIRYGAERSVYMTGSQSDANFRRDARPPNERLYL